MFPHTHTHTLHPYLPPDSSTWSCSSPDPFCWDLGLFWGFPEAALRGPRRYQSGPHTWASPCQGSASCSHVSLVLAGQAPVNSGRTPRHDSVAVGPRARGEGHTGPASLSTSDHVHPRGQSVHTTCHVPHTGKNRGEASVPHFSPTAFSQCLSLGRVASRDMRQGHRTRSLISQCCGAQGQQLQPLMSLWAQGHQGTGTDVTEPMGCSLAALDSAYNQKGMCYPQCCGQFG